MNSSKKTDEKSTRGRTGNQKVETEFKAKLFFKIN
jgi:hypothetical protein